jgi:hypothetical protein
LQAIALDRVRKRVIFISGCAVSRDSQSLKGVKNPYEYPLSYIIPQKSVNGGFKMIKIQLQNGYTAKEPDPAITGPALGKVPCSLFQRLLWDLEPASS